MFGAWMGLRRLEMAQINIATDIEDNPEEMRLLVHGKGIKERVLPVPGELARAIRRRGGDWIFPGRFDGHACGITSVVFCQIFVGRFGVSFSPFERLFLGRFGFGQSCGLSVIA